MKMEFTMTNDNLNNDTESEIMEAFAKAQQEIGFLKSASYEPVMRPNNIPSRTIASDDSDSNDSDKSSGEVSDDSTSEQNWKRIKISKHFDHFNTTSEISNLTSTDYRKSTSNNKDFADAVGILQNKSTQQPVKRPINKFSIWSNVLAEQGLVNDLNSVGVKSNCVANERECESYDYTVKYRLPGGNDDPHEIHPRLGLKRNSTDRNSSHLPMLDKKRRSFIISEDDDVEKVVAGIAAILREPKKDLIGRVVSTIGTKKSVELLKMTEDIEEAGGVMTLDNARRRTPGGVFLQLLKTDKYISKTEKDVIFEVERAEYQKARKQIVKSKKRREQRKGVKPKEMDVSEQPCSDGTTNVESMSTLPTLAELIYDKNEQPNKELGAVKIEEIDNEKEPGQIDSDDSTDQI